jgi:hypothetical protein
MSESHRALTFAPVFLLVLYMTWLTGSRLKLQDRMGGGDDPLGEFFDRCNLFSVYGSTQAKESARAITTFVESRHTRAIDRQPFIVKVLC